MSSAAVRHSLGRVRKRQALGMRPLAELLQWAERIASFVALVVLFPLGCVLGTAILALSGASPLVRHRRVGLHGRPLRLLKFRTMWERKPARRRFELLEDVVSPVPEMKQAGDERVTSRLALFCRRHSIDELPQLWHVARGEMSLVGPRPITEAELETYYGPAAGEILSIRPGMTGLWQVMGRSRLTYPQRRRLDLLLVRRASTGLYFHILLRSIPAVVTGRDAF